MNDANMNVEFVLRRFQENFSGLALLLPVAFAFSVLYLILFYRQHYSFADLLGATGIPSSFWSTTLFWSGAATFGLSLIDTTVLALIGLSSGESYSWTAYLLAWSPFLAFTAVMILLAIVTFVIICIQNTQYLWVVAAAVIVCATYVPLAYTFMPLLSWWVILAPVLATALVYVGLMYVKDAGSVGYGWASFLGVLRVLVYVMLTAVFLLPGCQGFDTSETHSKILFLFDVSDSMTDENTKPAPAVGQDVSTLPTRQQGVLKRYFGNSQFLESFTKKSAVELRRFGKVLDEMTVLRFPKGKTWTAAEWQELVEWREGDDLTAKGPSPLQGFLFPKREHIKIHEKMDPADQKLAQKQRDLVDDLRAGTNLGGALLQLARLEASSFVQAMYVFSDGQSNVGGDESLREFGGRINAAKKPIHVVAVGVGDYRQPVRIEVHELAAPEWARPDDKFLVKVPVVGQGLHDREFDCTVEMTKIVKEGDKVVAELDKKILPTRKGVFKGVGDLPRDDVEFEVDMQDLFKMPAASDEKGVMEGTWRFVAKVPRAPGETTTKKEHVSPPVDVLVQKRKLRILLFAGGPSREYQFMRTVLYREVLANRSELAIYLQTAKDEKGSQDHIDQDVEGKWFLPKFPDQLTPAPDHLSLSDYDVIVAVDPDWTQIDASTLDKVKQWVGSHSGGIIFVAGPVHTFHVARPGGFDMSAIKTIYPVVLKDSRLHGLGIGHDPTKKYYLEFSKAAKNYEFLKLDESGESPIAGWDQFFWGSAGPEPGKEPRAGFHNYYPVEKLRSDSAVIANFIGPQASKINDGRDPQPFMVMMRYGQGKSLYIGSSETWRLRTVKGGESFHERFWIKLTRFMAAGTSQQKKYGYFPLQQKMSPGNMLIEVQLKGEDLNFLPRDTDIHVTISRPNELRPEERKEDRVRLKPKATQGPWNGWFQASYRLTVPGEYNLKVEVPNTPTPVTHKIMVQQPNPETDNLRINFTPLYQVATLAQQPLNRIPSKEKDANKQKNRDVELLLKASAAKIEGKEQRDELRLFLDYPNAHEDILPQLVVAQEPDREFTKGKLSDLWDQGAWDKDQSPFWVENAYWLGVFTPVIVGLFGLTILLLLGRYVEGGIFAAAGILLALLIAVLSEKDWGPLEINFSIVLGTVVGLLSIEWLTRKLLKLA